MFLSQLVTACAKPWKVEICRDLQSAFAMDSMTQAIDDWLESHNLKADHAVPQEVAMHKPI